MELSDTKILKNIFKSFKGFTDFVELNITDESLSANIMDTSHIGLMHFELKEELFDFYKADDLHKVLVDLDNLIDCVELLGKDDRVILSGSDEELIIVGEGESTTEFIIKTIHEDYDAPKPPVLKPEAIVELSTDVFYETLKKVKNFNNEKICFEINEDVFRSVCETDDVELTSEYVHGEKVEGEYKSIYNIKMLLDFMKSKDLSDIIKVSFGQDTPIKLCFVTVDENAILSMILAPRIEND